MFLEQIAWSIFRSRLRGMVAGAQNILTNHMICYMRKHNETVRDYWFMVFVCLQVSPTVVVPWSFLPFFTKKIHEKYRLEARTSIKLRVVDCTLLKVSWMFTRNFRRCQHPNFSAIAGFSQSAFLLDTAWFWNMKDEYIPKWIERWYIFEVARHFVRFRWRFWMTSSAPKFIKIIASQRNFEEKKTYQCAVCTMSTDGLAPWTTLLLTRVSLSNRLSY